MSVSLYGSGQTILQVVQTVITTSFSTNSTSWVSTGFTASITPQSTNSKIMIMVNGTVSNSNNGGVGSLTVFRGTTSGTNLSSSSHGFGFVYVNLGYNTVAPFSLNYLDSPATTSATTYTLAMHQENSGTTSYFNQTPCTATITLLEVSGS